MHTSNQMICNGKLVALTYHIADSSGHILEQTDLPVTYVHGGNMELIGGMDAALVGKRAGDEVELHLTAEQGFGMPDPQFIITVAVDTVPPDIRQVGVEVQMQKDDGTVRSFFVTKIENGQLTIDGNHPLAGKELVVYIRVHDVREPNQAELSVNASSCTLLSEQLH